jgi:hypothetical protein
MPEDAEVRARHMKSLYAAVDGMPGGGAAVRARVPPEDIEAVAQASGADWIPLSIDLNLTHAIHDHLGRAGFDAFFREHTLRSFSGPLLGPLATALFRMIGSDPAALAGWLPRGWGFIFRGCGRWVVEQTSKGRVQAWLDRSPAICIEDPVWIPSVAASLGAIVDRSQVPGGVHVMSIDRASGSAVFEIRWDAPPES